MISEFNGICSRYPPSLAMVDHPEFGKLSRPVVFAGDTCGEYSPRPEREPGRTFSMIFEATATTPISAARDGFRGRGMAWIKAVGAVPVVNYGFNREIPDRSRLALTPTPGGEWRVVEWQAP